jgi:hypothetical protein
MHPEQLQTAITCELFKRTAEALGRNIRFFGDCGRSVFCSCEARKKETRDGGGKSRAHENSPELLLKYIRCRQGRRQGYVRKERWEFAAATDAHESFPERAAQPRHQGFSGDDDFIAALADRDVRPCFEEADQ